MKLIESQVGAFGENGYHLLGELFSAAEADRPPRPGHWGEGEAYPVSRRLAPRTTTLANRNVRFMGLSCVRGLLGSGNQGSTNSTLLGVAR